MKTREELEAIKAEIESYLKEGLKHCIGEYDGAKVRAELQKVLERAEKETDTPIELKKYNTAATDLLATMFMGIPEGFDPHTMLREMPTPFLIMLRENFSHVKGYPLNIIWLEIFYREGKLIDDWSFERISDVEAKLGFQLKQALDYIPLNMTVNEEKKN